MKIVFFDGYCNLCNAFVDWLIRKDTKAQLKFASLQGVTAASSLGSAVVAGESDPSTVIYLQQDKQFERSSAVLHILADLGGAWRLMLFFLLVPSFLRDLVYKIIAKYRFRIFGKSSTCRVPTEAEKGRLLP